MSVPLLDVLARVRRRSLPLLLLCAALLPLLVAAEALGWRTAAGPPDLPAAADTTVLFGPKQFNATSAGALYVEQFSTALDHAATYVLEVTNGTAGGTNRVVNGAVKLNGTTVVSATDLQNEGRIIARAVWPADGTNTVQVEAKGNSALYMNVRLLRIIPQARPLYRHGWRKTTAAYQVFHDSFNTPRGVSMPGRLYVEQGSAADSVFLNGQRIYPSCVPDLNNNCITSVDPFHNVSLQAVNAIRVEMGGPVGSAVVVRVEAVDTMAPVVAVTAPAQQLITKENTVTVTGTVTDDSPPVTLTINGDTVPVDGTTGAFSHPVALAHDGTHTIQLVARDGATSADGGIVDGLDPEGGTAPQGNVAQFVRTVIRDSQAPALALSAPADGAVVDAATILVQGSVTDATALTVNVNGVPVTPDAAGAFALEVALAEGANFVTASATDAAGNVSTVTRQVTRSAPPALAVSAPLDGSVTPAASVNVQGTATGAAPLSLTLNGSPVAIGADGAFSQSVPLAVGANTFTLVLTDGGGRTATATRSVTREAGEPLPPDPATVAPALERGVATDFAASNAFLYTGDDPIQTGVAPGTIEPRRVGVLRGRVLTRDGAPLPGVRVSVLGHPELGQTLSRENGMFDLAANGGGELVLSYEKAGVLPAQRPVQVDWRRFTTVDDVRLVTLDTAVTVVDFSQPAQVARGSVVADGDGPRQATLLFRQGTRASLEMPDGTLIPAPSLSIRATEYTVGPDGRAAMPGPLPPNVAYTYAVELSADEAIAAGAAHVRFDRPVSVYVDNFLEFPAGTVVPAAWFDRTRGLWVPQDDGRVVAVLSVDGGTAAVDVNGDGAAEGQAALDAHGFDAAELARVATLYAPGTTLWRVQTTHFTPVDLNHPAGFGGGGPPPDPPPGPGPDPDGGDDDLCAGRQPGSVIECQTRVLGEHVAVVGTPYSLAYRSSRVPGRAGGRGMSVRLTADSVSPSLHSIRVDVEIAGRRFTQTYAPAANLMHQFEWDGLDAYGRPVQGRETARVKRTYLYPLSYYFSTRDTARLRSFGLVCQNAGGDGSRQVCSLGSPSPQDPSRGFYEQTDERDWVLEAGTAPPMGVWDARSLGLGGWTLDVHHAYDPRGMTLHMGNGTTLMAAARNGEVRNVAGRRDSCPRAAEPVCGDGGPATEAWLEWVDGMAFGPDGSLYLGDWAARKMRRLRPDGVLETFAGTGVLGFSGMGGPATAAKIGSPMDADVGPDGSVYIADAYWSRVYRVTPDGIIHLLAGNGQWNASAAPGDGGPATAAPLSPKAVAVGPDGAVYIVDSDNHRIRRVGPDGTIHTIAGTGICGEDGDGGPATLARLCYPADIVFGPDGSMYISDSPRIRKVTPDGMITTVAGYLNSPDCFGLFYDQGDPHCGEGLPATQVPMYGVTDLEVGPDGSLYFAHRGIDVVRRLDADGNVRTVAGISTFIPGIWCNTWAGAVTGDPECGNGAGARQVEIRPAGALVGPDGKLYVNDYGNNFIRRVGPPLESYSDDRFFVPSADGGRLFVFNAAGRHLETRNTFTGRLIHAFTYDAGGLLAGVTDADGAETRVERAAGGTSLAIVGPYGQRTELALDVDGWLSGVLDPAGRTLAMSYTGDGLLTSLTDPRGGTAEFEYQPTGHLFRDNGVDQGFKRLDRFTENCMLATGERLYGRPPTGPVFSCLRGSGVRVTTAMGRTTVYWTWRDGDRVFREVISPAGTRTLTEVSGDGASVTRAADGSVQATSNRRDSRFGMMAAGVDSLRLSTPAGLTTVVRTSSRTVVADPENPLSLVARHDSTRVNGRLFTSAYDAQLRRHTTRSPAGRTVHALMDAQGRLVERQQPGLAPARFEYDSLGRLARTTRLDRTWTYGYDALGRRDRITDPLSRTTLLAYDAAGQVTRATLPDGREVAYTYDAAGNISTLTPPGRQAHAFGRTPVGAVEFYIRPGGTPGAPADTAARYAYNLDGQVTRVERGGGVLLLDYDGGGRVTLVDAGADSLRFVYDPLTGRPVTVRGPDAVTHLGYDGSLTTSIRTEGGVAGTVNLAYDHDWRLSGETVVGASTVAYGYDADGLLAQAGDLVLARDSASGRLVRTSVGGVATAYTYDAHGELAGVQSASGSNVLLSTAYVRDALGRATRLTETGPGGTRVWEFAYDSAGRVRTVHRDGTPWASYEYDANGNRTAAVTASGAVSGVYDGRDRLLQYAGAEYGYAPGGELAYRVQGGDTLRTEYDLLGNLRSARMPDGTTVEYLVDAANHRIGKAVNGTLVQRFVYGGGAGPVAEVDGTGAVVSRFVYGTRSNVPDYMVRGGERYAFVLDHVGSVRRVVNAATGAVAQEIDYDPFGQVIRDTNPGFQPFGFGGGLADAHTGLVRFGARDYDPRTGRWTAPDPLGFKASDTNLYQYVMGDPVNMRDPSGLFASVCIDGLDVNIYLPMTFQRPTEQDPNGFTDAQIDRISRDIENYWTGKHGDYTVTLTMVTEGPAAGANRAYTLASAPTGGNRAHASGDIFMYLDPNSSAYTAAHEAGHILGLIDRYDDVVGKDGKVYSAPHPEWEYNIMGKRDGVVDQRNIEEILNDRNNQVIPCQCRQ